MVKSLVKHLLGLVIIAALFGTVPPHARADDAEDEADRIVSGCAESVGEGWLTEKWSMASACMKAETNRARLEFNTKVEAYHAILGERAPETLRGFENFVAGMAELRDKWCGTLYRKGSDKTVRKPMVPLLAQACLMRWYSYMKNEIAALLRESEFVETSRRTGDARPKSQE